MVTQEGAELYFEPRQCGPGPMFETALELGVLGSDLASVTYLQGDLGGVK